MPVTNRTTPVVRRLIAATAVNALGNGLYAATAAVFLVRTAGLSIPQVGLGLTVAALVGLVASTPLGILADRLGANRSYVLFALLDAAALVAFARLGSFGWYVAVAALVGLADSGARAAKGALIAGVVPAGDRVRIRALLRVVTNVGMSVGIATGGLVLVVDRAGVYRAAILADALTCLLLAALLYWGLPEVGRTQRSVAPSGLTAIRDRPFLAFVALDGVLTMHNAMIQVALPLWIASATDAPRWTISVLLLLNTAAVIGLQVRVARGTEHLTGAARAGRRAGTFLAAACAVLALTDHTSGVLTVVMLIGAALLHVVGEMLQSAGGWGVSFELAADGAQGQYQGAYAMGRQLGDLVGPATLTIVAVTWGWPGWLVAGSLFLAAGALIPVAVRHSTRTHPTPHPAQSPTTTPTPS